MKRWSDERVQELLAAHEQAPHETIEPEPVTKADPDDSPAWRAIRKRAEALVAEAGNAITFAEAVTAALEADPALYTRYRAEFERLLLE